MGEVANATAYGLEAAEDEAARNVRLICGNSHLISDPVRNNRAEGKSGIVGDNETNDAFDPILNYELGFSAANFHPILF